LSAILLCLSMELRIGVANFDNHDKVLDQPAAANPERQAATEQHLDELIAQARRVNGLAA
jgi:hypothetical protein